jgi:hypothetical protein
MVSYENGGGRGGGFIIDGMNKQMPEVQLRDVVRLRKVHPCGSDQWQVVRLGVDIGLVCVGCGRRVLLPRSQFNKQFKQLVGRGEGGSVNDKYEG